MVACKVLSLMLRQCFVIGPTLGFAATVRRLGWHVVTGLQITDSWGRLMPSAQHSWQASSGLLPPCHAALSHSIHATRGHAAQLPAAIPSFHEHSQPAPVHQQAPAAGGQGWVPRCHVDVIFLVFAVARRARCCSSSSRQIRRAWAVIYCTIAHAQCCSLFPISPEI